MSKELAANTTLSHYRIAKKIGAGGMGEVYLAEDTRLGRKVALKLLPAEFTKDEDRVRRFEQEARATIDRRFPSSKRAWLSAAAQWSYRSSGAFMGSWIKGRNLSKYLLQEMSANRYVGWLQIALVYAGISDNDSAFEWLERAYNEREGILIFVRPIAKLLPSVGVDQRMPDLIRRIGLPELRSNNR